MLKSFDKTKVFVELQSQFGEQLKCLELRTSVDNSILADLNDFYKRRAVVEQEYAECLFKLVQNFRQKLTSEQQRRQNWPKYSSLDLINTLIVTSHRTSQTHYTMANIFSQQMSQRMLDIQDDVSRLHKQSRELLQLCQQNVTNVCSKLYKSHKSYISSYHLADESKRSLEKSKEKLEKEEKRYVSKKKDFEKSAKFKKLSDDLSEKLELYETKCLSSTEARNEYLIQLAAANKAIEKFFSQEIHDVLECLSYGYHNNLSRAILNHINCEEALVTSHKTIVDTLHTTMNNIDARKDTGIFLESCQPAFIRIPEFKFQPAKNDNGWGISTEGKLKCVLANTITDLKSSIDFTIVEVDEIWKTIEEAAKNLNSLISQNDYEVADLFLTSKNVRQQRNKDSVSAMSSSTSSGSIDICLYTTTRNATRDQRIEQEIFYITCLQNYLQKNHKYHTTAAKLEKILSAFEDSSMLGGDTQSEDLDVSLVSSSKVTRQLTKKTHRRLGVQELQSKPRLFGGSLEDYIERTGDPIPLVITTCVQVINLYGMHHQGVFRIPGSQTEMNEYRELFEKGDSSLVTKKFGSRDVNSISGLLKMYFRELVEPVFPNCIFNRLIECSKEAVDVEICVANISNVVKELSDSVYVVLRYLFSFLNHLSDYADDNMMDPQNLAICFGPCLMPVPTDLSKLQFEYQPHVNHIVQLFIERFKDIFKNDHKKPSKPVYERFQPMLHNRYSPVINEESLIIDNDDNSELSLESPGNEINSEVHSTCDKPEDQEKQPENTKIHTTNNITRCQSTKSSDCAKENLNEEMWTKPHLTRKHSDSELRSITFATIIADFIGSSPRELNLHKGQSVKLYRKLSSHWWEGSINADTGDVSNCKDNTTHSKIGLIPHSYLRFNNDNTDPSLKNSEFLKNKYDSSSLKEPKYSNPIDITFEDNWDSNLQDISSVSDDYVDLISEGNDISEFQNRPITLIPETDDYYSSKEIKNEDELSLDNALAEMMQGFVDLEQKNTIRLRTSSKYRSEEASIALEKKFISPLSKHTPDLVRDLVSKKSIEKSSIVYDDDDDDDNSDTGSLDSVELPQTTKMTCADTFAEQGLDTVKKKIPCLLLTEEININEDIDSSSTIPKSLDYYTDKKLNDPSPTILAMISTFENLSNIDANTKSTSPKFAPPLAPKPKKN